MINDFRLERPPPLSSDRPIEFQADDRLGFGALASKLAVALIDQASADGLVVGLEGRWGSGKSSLLNLTRKALEALPEAKRPIIVEFRPWLIGDRDALLGAFFSDLAKALEKESAALADSLKRRELAKRLQRYASATEMVGSAIAEVPVASVFGKLLKGLGSAGKAIKSKPSLLELKQELDEALMGMVRRVIIFIDDVDRLEPREVIELLRLVRSVADFKNVIHLLCFDSKILAQGIQTAIGVPDGQAYLEKIVQVEVAVPIPEPFQLRRWFETELQNLVGGFTAEERPSVTSVIDSEGGRRLSTPRHVIRVLNALRLLVPALREEVDLSDLVWLQLIKSDNHLLYRWVEEYSAAVAVASSWRVNVSEESQRRSFEALQKALAFDETTFKTYGYELAEHLPGIGSLSARASEDKFPIYETTDRRSLESAIRGRRLGSPDHYRLYFALAQPSTAARVEDFDQLLEASTASPEAFSTLFRQWMRITDASIGSKAELMLERLKQRDVGALASEQGENVLRSLAAIADEAGQVSTTDEFGSPALWRETETVLPILLRSLDPARREAVVTSIFAEGEAIGWLTSLLRRETFAHGRYGDRLQDESQWLLTNGEFDLVVKIMIDRYRSMTIEDFRGMINPISALFAWKQAGDDEGPCNLLARTSETDDGFLIVVETLASRVRSSGGDYTILKAENIKPFLDFDAVKARIAALAGGGDPEIARRANDLLTYFANGESF